MKKQFFYAACLAAVLAGCSSENDFAGAPEEEKNPIEDFEDFAETTPYELKIGAVAPNASLKADAATRGTGSVGSTTDSKWDGQEIRVVMYAYEKNATSGAYEETNNFAKETRQGETDPVDIMGDIKFVTPTGESQEAVSGLRARYMAHGDLGDDTDVDYELRKYYPLQGRFSFYGYYMDDLIPREESTTEETGKYYYTAPKDTQAKQVTNIQIDGGNDIMRAQTIPFTSSTVPTQLTDGEDYYYVTLAIQSNSDTAPNWDAETWTNIINRSFSAWTARRYVQPILKFEHVLSQFKFNVIGGKESSVSKEVTGYEVTEAGVAVGTGTKQINTGIQITGLYVNMQNTFTMNLNGTDVVDAVTGDAVQIDLKSLYTADGTAPTPKALYKLDDATNVKPIIPTDYVKSGDGNDEYVSVGESLMLIPDAIQNNEIEFQVVVSQYVPYAEGKNVYFKKSTTLPAKVKIGDIEDENGEATSDTAFMGGKSYTINLTIYGFEHIEVYAMLNKWVDGGSTDKTPEDDFWN